LLKIVAEPSGDAEGVVMLKLRPEQKIHVYLDPVDMRRSIDGLCLLLSDELQQNPQNGDLYLFSNRTRDKVKCLYWDANGFVLHYKRIEKGRFNYSKYLEGDKLVISESQLQALLMGLDFHLLSKHPTEYQEFF